MDQKALVKIALKLMRTSTEGFPALLAFAHERVTRHNIRAIFGSLTAFEQYVAKNHKTEYAACMEKEEDTSVRTAVAEKTAGIVLKLCRWPTQSELLSKGITSNQVDKYFGSLTNLFNYVKKKHTTILVQLFSDKEFTDKRLARSLKEIKKSDLFAISTVVSGCEVHEGALASLKNFEVQNEAVSLFQPIADPARPKQGQSMFFDTRLREEHVIFKDLELNSKVKLLSLLYSAKRINPHDAATRFTANNELSIIASPKRRLTPRANFEDQPGYLASFGAITKSDYTTELYMSNGTAFDAQRNHHMGAGILQILGPNKYFFSNISFDEEGAFTHLSRRYTPSQVLHDPVAYCMLGDFHAQTQVKGAYESTKAILDWCQPRELFIQDADSAITVNPFDARKPISQFHNCLEVNDILAGVEILVEKLYDLKGSADKINVVASNHELFYQYYILSGRYAKDVLNMKIGHQMALWLIDDKNINLLEKLCRYVDKKVATFVNFLKPYESCKRMGVEQNCHGHLGANGNKNPNLTKLLEAYGPVNAGHAHRSEMVGDAMRVGTMEGLGKERPSYARAGASSWSQSLILGYDSGDRQLVHLHNTTDLRKLLPGKEQS